MGRKNVDRGGRPTKKKKPVVEILLQALREGLPIIRACDYAEIDHQTFYNWLATDESFSIRVRWARACAIRRLVLAQEGKDPWKLLKSLDPESFNDDFTIGDASQVRDPKLKEMSTADLLKLHRHIKSQS